MSRRYHYDKSNTLPLRTARSSDKPLKRGLGFSLRSVVITVFVVLTICVIISTSRNSGRLPTFQGFLEFVQDVPSVEFSDTFNDLRITSSWGPFNFLRNFLNWTTGIIGFGAWLAEAFINLLLYVFSYIRYIFAF